MYRGFILLLVTVPLYGQSVVYPGAAHHVAPPSGCDSSTFVRGDGTCAAVGGSLPAGIIVMILSGTCPTGFTEVAALNGKTVIGTLASNGNVGTTGGSDTITPTGSVAAPSFTGNAWTPPALSWPAGVPTYTGALGTLAVTAHTVVSTKQGTSAGNVVTTATHTITGAPGGTIAWPAGVPTIASYTPTGSNSAPSFTGTQFDNRSAFVRAIFCSKD